MKFIFKLTSSILISSGESGLGKSTLVNSLFLTDLYKDRKMLNAEGIYHITELIE